MTENEQWWEENKRLMKNPIPRTGQHRCYLGLFVTVNRKYLILHPELLGQEIAGDGQHIYHLSFDQCGKSYHKLTLKPGFRGWLDSMAPSYFYWGCNFNAANISFLEKSHELMYRLKYDGSPEISDGNIYNCST